MSAAPVQRTQYWNAAAGTVRTGATGHGESLTDMEDYVLRIDRVRGAGLFSWGVAAGLSVGAVAGSTGLTVSAGSALDAAGRTIALVVGGAAVVDPTVDPGQVVDVPTVLVPAAGLALPTAGPAGDLVVTLTWREVQGDSAVGSAPVLLHAPWVRLVPTAAYTDDGSQVPLAQVSVDATGSVLALTTGPRRSTGLPGGSLRLRAAHGPAAGPAAGAPLQVEHADVAELAADPTGGVRLDLLDPVNGPRTALRVDTGGGLTLTGGLDVGGSASVAGDVQVRSLTVEGETSLSDVAVSGSTRMAGKLAIGLDGRAPQRVVHAEGDEIHSGGAGGGFSFADRTIGGPFVDIPEAGERWVWYSHEGAAHLWSKFDRITVSATGEGGGLDVGRRMRVRQGGDGSAGIWFCQDPIFRGRFRPLGGGDRAFVGMQDNDHVGFWGNGGVGWGLTMDVTNGNVGVVGTLTVNGTIFKNGGGFRIDHPLAPAEKYLAHSFVESPDMATLYAGTAVTDDEGLAEVRLPHYFHALNEEARVQLTTVGRLTAVTLADRVHDGRFTIRTAEPRVTVDWLVTAVRVDEWAQQNRIVVESDKPEHERGHR